MNRVVLLYVTVLMVAGFSLEGSAQGFRRQVSIGGKSGGFQRNFVPGGSKMVVSPYGRRHRHHRKFSDRDRDSVSRYYDRCSATPFGVPVWLVGPQKGCAHGQSLDRNSKVTALDPNLDSDADGIRDGEDRCTGTEAEAKVWQNGKWKGCAGGQFVDRS